MLSSTPPTSSPAILSKNEIQTWLHEELVRPSFGTTVHCGRFAVRRCHFSGKINFVQLIADPGDDLESEIVSHVHYFQALNQSFEWTVESNLLPAGLTELLRQHGFQVGPSETVVVRPVTEFESPSTDRVRLIQSESDLEAFKAVASEVFQKDYSLTTQDLRDHIQTGNEDHVAFLGVRDRNPVAVARLYSSSNSAVAGLYGAGTLPAFRGQGHYRDLIAARAVFARSRGSKLLRIDALPTSLPILLRLGFTKVCESSPWIWRPTASAG